MKLQSKPWKCGPATVRNVLRAFGVKDSEDHLTHLCRTTKMGTDEFGIMDAIKHHGFRVSEYRSNSKKDAWKWVHGSLIQGEAIILCTQAWEHWVVCVGSLGDRVVVIDSSNFKYNVAENGVHVWSREWLKYQ